MYTTLVKKGDVIRIKKGMHVNTLVPENVFNVEKPFSKEYCNAVVKVGKVYESSPYSKKKVSEKINSFLNNEFGISLPELKLSSFVNQLPIDYEVKSYDTSFLEGEYVVSDAYYLEMRINPYQVLCFKRDDPNIKIMFFQNTPFFKANINKEIEVIDNISNNQTNK